MGHDTHFLERLERLPRHQVDVALSLYRDQGLVKSLLGALEIPDGVERVAVSLGDPRLGPFVVVARDGRFVTCLAEGTGVSDTPIVTKEKFDGVSRRVQRVREMEEEAAKYPNRETDRMLRRLMNDGAWVTREQFLAVAAWCPLLGLTLLVIYYRLASNVNDLFRSLARLKRFGKKEEPALRRYWQDSWALAHLSLLVGVDGGALVRGVAEEPELAPDLERLTWPTIRTGVGCLAARGMWLAGRVGKPLVPLLKPTWRNPRSDLRLLTAGLSLAAIGVANQRLRAEVRKVLAQEPDAELENQRIGSRALGRVLGSASRARPEEFYLPASTGARGGWTPTDSLVLLEPRRRRERRTGHPTPVTAARVPGPNESCSCGSGKKYKRCCRP